MPESPPKLCLKLVICVEGQNNAPVGPRFQRANPMPYANHAAKHRGYYFDPDDYNTATDALWQLQEYINQGHAEQIKPKATAQKKNAHPKGKQAKLVDTAPDKVGKGVRRSGNKKV